MIMSPEIPIDEKPESPDPRSPHFYIKDTDLNNFSCLLKNTDWGTHIIDMDYNGRMISNNGLFDTIRVTFVYQYWYNRLMKIENNDGIDQRNLDHCPEPSTILNNPLTTKLCTLHFLASNQ